RPPGYLDAPQAARSQHDLEGSAKSDFGWRTVPFRTDGDGEGGTHWNACQSIARSTLSKGALSRVTCNRKECVPVRSRSHLNHPRRPLVLRSMPSNTRCLPPSFRGVDVPMPAMAARRSREKTLEGCTWSLPALVHHRFHAP